TVCRLELSVCLVVRFGDPIIKDLGGLLAASAFEHVEGGLGNDRIVHIPGELRNAVEPPIDGEFFLLASPKDDTTKRVQAELQFLRRSGHENPTERSRELRPIQDNPSIAQPCDIAQSLNANLTSLAAEGLREDQRFFVGAWLPFRFQVGLAGL